MRTSIRNFMAQYTPFGRFWLVVAVIALVVDAGISYQYGITQTKLHGVGFALVAAFFAFLPDAAYREYEGGRKASALVLSIICIPLGLMAYYSHIGYGAGVRVGDVQETNVQRASFKNTQALVVEEKANLDNLRDRLKTAKKEREDLKAAAPWAATVTADGLKGELQAIDEAIRQEANRKFCGEKCLALKNKRADVDKRIGATVKFNELTSQIAALDLQVATIQGKLDEKTKVAGAAKFHKSSVMEQTNVASKLFLAWTGSDAKDAINPDEVTFEFTNIFIAGAGALAFMLMAPVGFFIAGRNRIRQIMSDVNIVGPSATAPHVAPVAPQHKPIALRDSNPFETFKRAYERECDKRGAAPLALVG